MNDTWIEKNLIYLVVLSLLLHIGVYALIAILPEGKKRPAQEPFMVDLQDLPQPSQPPPSTQEEKQVRRLDQFKRRVPVEMAPKGEAPVRRETARPMIPVPAPAPPGTAEEEGRAEMPVERGRENGERRAEDFFRKKEQPKGYPSIEKLFPSADKLARLEEGYRKNYGPEVKEGEASFLNTDDLLFGSFLRRFESAVYGVWRYPPEAAQMGIEGVTPVRITFNRKGEITKVQILESSGSRILDEEVRRTLRMVGVIGGFPKGYEKEEFNLIAFFHYGIVRGRVKGTLH